MQVLHGTVDGGAAGRQARVVRLALGDAVAARVDVGLPRHGHVQGAVRRRGGGEGSGGARKHCLLRLAASLVWSEAC